MTRTINGIVPSTRKDGRFVVHLDGDHSVTVSLEIIDRLRLVAGAALSAGTWTELERDVAVLATYDRALSLLAFRARSAAELRRRLVQKGEAGALVDAAVERLLANGVLDDAEYARQLARSKLLGQGVSRRRLQLELGKRGVDRSVADEAIAYVLADEAVDEGDVVRRAAARKLRSLAKVDPATRRRRLYAYLARRGYESDAINDAMRQVLDVAESRETRDSELE